MPTFLLVSLWLSFKGKSALGRVWGFRDNPIWSVANPVFCVQGICGVHTHNVRHSPRPWAIDTHKGHTSPCSWENLGAGRPHRPQVCHRGQECANLRQLPGSPSAHPWHTTTYFGSPWSPPGPCGLERAWAYPKSPSVFKTELRQTHTSGLLSPPAYLDRATGFGTSLASSVLCTEGRVAAQELGTECHLHPRHCGNNPHLPHISRCTSLGWGAVPPPLQGTEPASVLSLAAAPDYRSQDGGPGVDLVLPGETRIPNL